MSIADRITSMSNNLSNAYHGIEYLGVDTSGVDKNLQNLSNVLDTVYNEYPKVSDEGINPSLDGSKVGRLSTALKASDTTQEGTPTPDNPVTINVVNGENSVTVCGKNLFNKDNFISVLQTYMTTSGFWAVSPDRSQCLKFPVLPNKTYTISANNPNETIFRAGWTSSERNPANNSPIQLKNWYRYSNTNTPITITTGDDAKYIIIQTTVANIDTTKQTLQVEKGSEATTYEPYTGTTYPINLPQGLELCKINTYQDKLFKAVSGDTVYDSLTAEQKDGLVSGGWYKYGEIGNTLLNGSETVATPNDISYSLWKATYLPGLISNTGSEAVALVNSFKKANSQGASTIGTFWIGNSYINFNYDGTNANVSEFKSYLSYNNAKVYYALATPTITQITDSTLISQLENLYKAMSKNGQTNILQTNADVPFTIFASALMEQIPQGYENFVTKNGLLAVQEGGV